MENREFNEQARPVRYSYMRSPVHPRAFQILKQAQPVGDYMVLDTAEDLLLAEKKVMNIISALNGRSKLLQLGEETKSRQLFQLINDGANGERIKVMFYQYTGKGCSRENALFMLERDQDVFH